MNKEIVKVVVIFILASVLSFLLYERCNRVPEKVVEYPKAYIDSVTNEANKANELAEFYARQYDEQARKVDSLRKVGAKVIVRYQTVKEKGDTVTIVKTCDSLAVEYQAYMEATDHVLATVDSLLEANRVEIRSLRSLDSVKSEVISNLQIENTAWKKLAKRRGRAIEW
jgi:exosome complex RNA-binding protein Csl4